MRNWLSTNKLAVVLNQIYPRWSNWLISCILTNKQKVKFIRCTKACPGIPKAAYNCVSRSEATREFQFYWRQHRMKNKVKRKELSFILSPQLSQKTFLTHQIQNILICKLSKINVFIPVCKYREIISTKEWLRKMGLRNFFVKFFNYMITKSS